MFLFCEIEFVDIDRSSSHPQPMKMYFCMPLLGLSIDNERSSCGSNISIVFIESHINSYAKILIPIESIMYECQCREISWTSNSIQQYNINNSNKFLFKSRTHLIFIFAILIFIDRTDSAFDVVVHVQRIDCCKCRVCPSLSSFDTCCDSCEFVIQNVENATATGKTKPIYLLFLAGKPHFCTSQLWSVRLLPILRWLIDTIETILVERLPSYIYK